MRRPARPLGRFGLSFFFALALCRCGYRDVPVEDEWLDRLASAPTPPPGDSWPVSPKEAERLLWDSPVELRSKQRTEGGDTGAQKVELKIGGRLLEAKWKEVPPETGDAWNNSPRKELAAYAIQKWFLDPADYVVPTVAVRCLPVGEYREFVPNATPTLESTTCVLGTVFLWLRNVRVADPLYEPDRFVRDPAYAYHIANLNVLTYLIEHEDARWDNFLEATDRNNRRVFSVDNGITFDETRRNYLVENWDEIHVPALRREAVDRLRRLRRQDVEALETLALVVADDQGILQPVIPASRANDPPPPDRPSLRFGLTPEERDTIWNRRNELLERVDNNEIALF